MIDAILVLVAEALERRPDVAARIGRALGAGAPDEVLTLARAAEEIGVAPRLLADAARSGRLAVVHAGRSPRVRRRDLDAWLSSRSQRRPGAHVSTATDPDEWSAIVERSTTRLRRAR